MSKPQYINDVAGKPQYVVLPIDEYERLISNDWADVPYRAGDNDDEVIPHDVVSIMVDQDVSLIAAWRIHRGLSQYEVAERLGTTQSAVSQWESVDSKPQKKTREKLAALYNCRPEQMTQ
ncbi:helix-turn-helix domain-containing protein [Serratia rhizosphaerae]|uniref:Helix-turn-helix transcriptional regulator n=1 Tax=Serratia rhizosphaerae TaxID=2597702 RepID=A0ABX6GH21_9GAMM|nr:helix-turn-helix transcriptional regulator [Serratia rhizosphaerae]QHA85557.1 helix-turn-helix transcriptional regulator [Serratia rhizosphaerae]